MSRRTFSHLSLAASAVMAIAYFGLTNGGAA